MRKIKPLENKKNISLSKLSLIGVFVIAALVFSKLSSKTKEAGQVLGERLTQSSAIEEEIVKDFSASSKDITSLAKDKVNNYANDIMEKITEQTSKTVLNIASKSSETAGDILFQATIGNIIKEVDKLPEKQKQEVKKTICE